MQNLLTKLTELLNLAMGPKASFPNGFMKPADQLLIKKQDYNEANEMAVSLSKDHPWDGKNRVFRFKLKRRRHTKALYFYHLEDHITTFVIRQLLR